MSILFPFSSPTGQDADMVVSYLGVCGWRRHKAERARKMSDRLIDKGDKRADKNTSGFECHPGLCFRKGKKKKTSE